MAIYTIGDLHLSLGCEKPMDIFPGWQGYMEKLEHHWNTLVRPEDTVVLAGDTSWAMKLEDTVADFSFLQRLPGQKLLLKGNHDYWWTTVKKMERFLQENGFDEKVMNRELGRLRASLEAAPVGAERVAFLHYPPVYPNANAQQVIDLLKEYNVKRCFYGHLHGNAIRFAVQGMVDGIEYRLISADALAFCPYKI